jgi:GNAT superfamily N-acetyltransferase
VLRHLHDARARGRRTASLQSSAMAEHLYRTIGFRDLGRTVEYVPARTAPEYRLRPARADEADRLREIEDEAGVRFAGLGLNDDELDSAFPRDELLPLLALGQVWVVCTPDDVPVGAVIASERDGAAYIEELDVVPAHGRRGIGGQLVECVCEWARTEGLPAVALSTFRDVPWNGPFYRRHGFRDLTRAEWSASMASIRETEERHGLVVEARTFMRRELH